ncbi:MAG: serpin family protein [Prolixibacteraceae bacterium]|jgi:serine protease inhibitor|nr:serpin family protein [Prolixibacteraceae bacterium]
MKTKFAFYSIILSIFFVVSCKEIIEEPKPINIDLKSKQLVEADNAFGLELVQQLNKVESGNFTISPLSISLALAMTYNGAKGETKTAMEETLKLAGLTTDEINQSYQSLVKALLEADDKVTLGVAQSIWYREGYNVLDNFISINQKYFDAEVNELDFGRDDAKDIMNGWIEDHTNQKIKDMITRVDPSHVMFLINAIYFNGDWQTMFDKSETRKMNFFSESKGNIDVDMMMKEDSVLYTSNDLFKAIELPYGRGNFNMLVLRPNNDKTCSDIIENLTPENWKTWTESLQPQTELDIWLPKFKDEYKIKLNDILSALGMDIAFTQSADFSGINGTGGIWIDYVQHNTFIDVNEAGTEAAAATVVAIKELSMPQNPVFHADRSFIYAITEKETGAILFIGKIDEPNYE